MGRLFDWYEVVMKFQRRQTWVAAALVAAGIVLSAAAMDPGLPEGYWEQPQAVSGDAPHHWSKLEKNLHPEACGQCHIAQFNAWENSLHAHAYSAGMIGQFPDMGVADSNDCLKCHAPLKSQRYRNAVDLNRSLELKLAHPEGFDRNADMGATALPLRHSGVSCAVCHVRGWQRFGPPPKTSGAVGHQQRQVHGGFTATRAFEQPQFCASCHQFPDTMAIHGKPLENTLNEWKQSKFSSQGVTCQTCHMPGRRHEFRGIHDVAMVKKGLTFALSQRHNSAVFSITSSWIGHAFPTYVTPEVVVEATAMNSDGKALHRWQWEIVREVVYDDGWKELRDTRLMPGEHRAFIAGPLPKQTAKVRYRVRVMPDHFYKGVYEGLLDDRVEDHTVAQSTRSGARSHIVHALERAKRDDYLLYEQTIPVSYGEYSHLN